MLKLRLQRDDGQPSYWIGLSEADVRELTRTRPARIDLSELDEYARGEVVIFAGISDETMIRELQIAGRINTTTARDLVTRARERQRQPLKKR